MHNIHVVVRDKFEIFLIRIYRTYRFTNLKSNKKGQVQDNHAKVLAGLYGEYSNKYTCSISS